MTLVLFGCPHCAGLGVQDCHVCYGRRVVDEATLALAMQWAWKVKGCPCAACKALAEQPCARVPPPEPPPPQPVQSVPVLPRWKFRNRTYLARTARVTRI